MLLLLIMTVFSRTKKNESIILSDKMFQNDIKWDLIVKETWNLFRPHGEFVGISKPNEEQTEGLDRLECH